MSDRPIRDADPKLAVSFHSIRDLVVYAIKNNIIQIDMPVGAKNGSPAA